MGIGTFGYFTQARLAIYAAHTGLGVTGNNISNVNTDGYTRQRLDQSSFYRMGVDRYYSANEVGVGLGVRVDNLQQVRDPYLDIRYRSEAAVTGQTGTRFDGLQNLENILDEIGDGELPEGDDFGIMAAYLSEIRDSLSKLVGSTGQTEFDTQVRSNSEALVDQFHVYSANMTELYQNSIDSFKQDVEDANGILQSIQKLNENIRLNDIFGDSSLELRDERNRKIDELAELVKIKVTYTTEDIGAGREIEKLVISLDNANPDVSKTTDESKLVDGIYIGQLSIRPVYSMIANPGGSTSIEMTDHPEDVGLPAGQRRQVPVYLDANGEKTTDREKAADDPYFRMDLSELKDSKGTLFHEVTAGAKQYFVGDETQTAYEKYLQAIKEYTGPKTDPETGIQTISVFAQTKEGGYYRQDFTREPSKAVELEDNDLAGGLQAWRELLTEKGEFASAEDISIDPNAGSKRGIPYYQNMLDLLAQQIAQSINKANQGYLVNPQGQYIASGGTNGQTVSVTDAAGTTHVIGQNTSVTDLNRWLGNGANYTSVADYLDRGGTNGAAVGQKIGVNLFSNHGTTDDDTGITAANISISKTWQTGPQIVSSFVCPTGFSEPASTDSSNILHIQNLFETRMDYYPQTVAPDAQSSERMFYGTFEEMWTNISTVLGNDKKLTTNEYNTSTQNLTSIDSSRANVSSVDFNEEAMNLMQYAKSYNAACRLMTTLDSVLDKLINGTGVTT